MDLKALIRKVGLPFVAIMLIITGGAIKSFANNHLDTHYEFNLIPNVASYTDGRQKQDATSSYMKCYSTTPTSTYYYGRVVANLGDGVHKEVNGSNYQFKGGITHYMSNYAHEQGYSAVAIRVVSGSNSHVEGVWSPDSVGGK